LIAYYATRLSKLMAGLLVLEHLATDYSLLLVIVVVWIRVVTGVIVVPRIVVPGSIPPTIVVAATAVIPAAPTSTPAASISPTYLLHIGCYLMVRGSQYRRGCLHANVIGRSHHWRES
jgi:hypothetical protein